MVIYPTTCYLLEILGGFNLNLKNVLIIFVISIIVTLTPAIACEISAQNPIANIENNNHINLSHLVNHPNLSKINQVNTEKNIKTIKIVAQNPVKKQVTTKSNKNCIVIKKVNTLKSKDKIGVNNKKVSSIKTITTQSDLTQQDMVVTHNKSQGMIIANNTEPKVALESDNATTNTTDDNATSNRTSDDNTNKVIVDGSLIAGGVVLSTAVVTTAVVAISAAAAAATSAATTAALAATAVGVTDAALAAGAVAGSGEVVAGGIAVAVSDIATAAAATAACAATVATVAAVVIVVVVVVVVILVILDLCGVIDWW